ncbi:MAG: geranylgeranylglyceryl/heptaprenylglyceryl phosphate synthase [Bacteroidota bacterium]|nr:geranylgeranylglyceryl/heptaprenylglyceryl phosphate synthase [Bacteroidota bacterium]
MKSAIYKSITEQSSKGKKQFAVLIDPDKISSESMIRSAEKAGVDLLLVGGSLLTNGNFEECIQFLKKNTQIPIVIFPGNGHQISSSADAILLLSLISGRNPDLLIGNHVIAAPMIKSSQLEVISTGYMLIESGRQTSALYMSNTNPIPSDKDDIAMCTAMAGEMLGLKMIYMDAGSGALNPVSETMIRTVKNNVHIPVMVGGGIKTVEQAVASCKAGADIIVVGNAIEKDPGLIKKISDSIHQL